MQLLENKSTITSLELVEQINIFRAIQKEKFPEDRLFSNTSHDSLLKIIREEFSEEINEGEVNEVSYLDKKGEKRPCFNLTLNQAKQVLIRESKIVRKAVVLYIEKLEQNLSKQLSISQMFLQSAQALVDLEKRQDKIESKVDFLLDVREQSLLQLTEVERSVDKVPEIGTRLKINQIIRKYNEKTGIEYKDIWNSMYNKMLYTYHFNVNAYKKLHDKESKLDIVERCNQLDNLFALVSKELN